jgi:hypothetical protein
MSEAHRSDERRCLPDAGRLRNAAAAPGTARARARRMTISDRTRRIVELAARWYVFVFLNNYGLGKMFGGQFYRPGHLPARVAAARLADATDFDLAWTFMGRSFGYILFIGLAEVIGAWLLLWNRTKLLGVAVLLPVMVNVIAFDVFFLDKYGALASATIYTVLLVVIAALNKDEVTRAVRALMPKQHSPAPRGHAVRTAILALVAMALLFAFDQLLVNLLGR